MLPEIRVSLRALRAFATVVETGSITAAARALNIAPSAIAAALDQVEAEFGASLLIRTRARGIAPTPEGREMAARFRNLLEDYHTVMAAGQDIAQTLTGTLRIGYYAPVAPAFLPRILSPMMRENPALRLDLREYDNDSAQDALLAGQLDVILFVGHEPRSGIETRELLDLPPYVLAAADQPVAQYKSTNLAKVAQHPLIQLNRPFARPYVDALFADRGLDPRIAAHANSTEMVRSLVGAGLGLAILNMRPRTDLSYGGDRLRAVPLDGDLPALSLHSGCATGHARKLVQAFLKALHHQLSRLDGPTLTCPPIAAPSTSGSKLS